MQDVAPNEVSHVSITGEHEVNATWVSHMRSAGVLVVPRVVWEAGHLSAAQQLESVNQLATLVRRHSLDGLVLELPNIRAYTDWLSRLCSRLHSIQLPPVGSLSLHNGLCLAVLRPPVTGEGGRIIGGTTVQEFQEVADLVDRISLMTYDFSVSNGRAGPNAPLVWMQHCVEVLTQQEPNLRQKILLGMPFYGYDVGQPLVGSSYLDLLKTYKPQLQWDKRGQEHSFAYRRLPFVNSEGSLVSEEDHIVYFPTLLSQSLRMNATVSMGVAGVSIWEAGQGLPYFWDIL